MSESESNSLLDQLQKRLTTGLKPTTTKTTFADGTVQYATAQGSTLTPGTSNETSFGFVVDEKPDLTIGRVTPWLFLSSQDVPGDKDTLSSYGITRVLSLLPGYKLPPQTVADISNHLILDFYDEECFRLDSSLLKQAFEFINQAKVDCVKVLVHCNAGISRAPSVTIAYLMSCEGMSFKDAFLVVKAVRPGIKPNAGFMKQLEEMDRQRL